MRSGIYFVSVVFVLLTLFSHVIHRIETNEQKKPSERSHQLPPVKNFGVPIENDVAKQKIIAEAKEAFADELFDLEEAHQFTIDDLYKLSALIGKKDSHLQSLYFLLGGMALGEKRLFIARGQAETNEEERSLTGYILYQRPDGTNVLETLKRGEKYWEVVSVKTKNRLESQK